jgi:hypothetical protein
VSFGTLATFKVHRPPIGRGQIRRRHSSFSPKLDALALACSDLQIFQVMLMAECFDF